MTSRRDYAALALAAAVAIGGSVRGVRAQTTPSRCDRQCLRGILTAYLDAVVAHDPHAVPTTADVRFTEDGRTLALGEGLWKTASRLGAYRVDFIDVREGVAGTQTIIDDRGSPAMVAVRLKIVGRKISEIETMAVRDRKQGIIFDVEKLQTPTKAMTLVPDPSQRNTRDEMVRIAERYPAGLKRGSFADIPFAPDAYRFENGRLMAGPGCTFMPGCTNIKGPVPTLAGLTYRVAAVDEELGVVWLHENFGPGSVPRSDDWLDTFEAFKVYGGEIHAVEAFMEGRPAGARSIWDPRPAAERAAAEVAPRAAGYVAPRTPWGDPDLNGIWPMAHG